ncbi:hypothetical protein D3C76_808390 [compost metagenome]
MPVFVRQLSHFQQCTWLLAVQAQGFFQLLPGQIALTEHRCGHAQVLEHPRTLRIQGIGSGLFKALVGFVVTLLLEQETAVVIEDSCIAGTGSQRLAKMLVGKFRFHLGLEHQPQRRVGIRVGAIQLQCFLQRNLGALGHALLQIPDTELHIGLTRFITALAGLHRVVITRKHAASTQAGQQQKQRKAQGHRDPLLVISRRLALHRCRR